MQKEAWIINNRNDKGIITTNCTDANQIIGDVMNKLTPINLRS